MIHSKLAIQYHRVVYASIIHQGMEKHVMVSRSYVTVNTGMNYDKFGNEIIRNKRLKPD